MPIICTTAAPLTDLAAHAASRSSPHGIERRVAARTVAVFTVGKISRPGSSVPCMIRDLSEGGLRVQMRAPPKPGERVLVEMRGLEPQFARAVWTAGKEAGLAFDLPCDPAAIFAARSNRVGRRARQPRFAIGLTADLLIDGAPFPITVADLSVGGARLIVPMPIRDGSQVVLVMPLGDRNRIAGEICWSRDQDCGLRFLQPLSSLALAMMLEAHQTP